VESTKNTRDEQRQNGRWLARLIVIGPGFPKGAPRTGAIRRMLLSARAALVRSGRVSAPRSAARAGLGGAGASVMMAVGAAVHGLCALSGVSERHNGRT